MSLNLEEIKRQKEHLKKYLENETEIKLNCETIKDMNISQHVQDKFKIIVPPPINEDSTNVNFNI